MNNVIPGLIVAAITALVVAAIFFWTGQTKKKKIEALRTLCAQRGWKYRYDSGSLHHGHRIDGDGWAFEAVSRSSGRESAPGSSSWDHGTHWRSPGEDPGRSTFLLGGRSGGGLDLAQAAPLPLSRLFGEEISGLQAGDAGERLAARYILFTKGKFPAPSLFSARDEELLLAWPEKFLLVVRSSPARLAMEVVGRRLEKPDEVARFIELGASFLNR